MCYCLKVNEDNLHFLVLIFFLVYITVPISILSFANLAQEQTNEILYQNYFKIELAQKEKQIEIQKNAQEKIYLLGKFDPSQMPDFTVVPENDSVSGYTMYLRAETLNAFLNMAQAAEEDGVEFKNSFSH